MGRPAGEKRDAVGASAFVGNEKAGAGAVGCVKRWMIPARKIGVRT